MSDKIDKIYDKLLDISLDLGRMTTSVEKNTEDLSEHIRRTNLLEKKIEINEKSIRADLESNWAVVAEGIQNILRREGFPKPYEALKDLTRTNTDITESSIKEFILGLNVTEDIKAELIQITPFNYTGI